MAIDSPTGVQVTVENSSGQPITTNTDTITLSLGSNPGGGTLSVAVTEAAVNGVATFTNLSIAPAANGYTLVASDVTVLGTNPGTSTAFNVDAIPVFNSLLSFAPGGTSNGYNPDGTLVSDSAGNLYGTMAFGGLYGDGTIYELSGNNHSVLTTLVSFTGDSGSFPGASPFAGLTIDGNGNLFGTTSSGGSYDDGTVFELAANHTAFSSLVSFTGNSGAYPGQNSAANLNNPARLRATVTAESAMSY
jgi:uncharacterized repeat protein (TIGR03803 family)